MASSCSMCGLDAENCKGGLYHLNFPRPRHPGDIAICRYCARKTLRCVGEPGELSSAEPIWIFSRRPVINPAPDPGSAA